MKTDILKIMNIKPAESALVLRLLLVQFFLGLGTAFLNTASTAILLHTYEPFTLAYVYLITAGLLLFCNYFYAKLDAKLSSKKLLEWVLLFCMGTLFVFINFMVFAHAEWMAILMLCWNVIVYMLVGYGFWGLVSLLFDVRESRRVFGVVGAGDIPAKIIGYVTVSFLIKYVDTTFLLWFSFLFFMIGFWLIKTSFHKKIIDWASFESEQQHHEPHQKGKPKKSILERFFESNLIMAISMLSLLAYLVFGLVDFTFLSEIKVRYQSEKELASFIAMFFIAGRVTAIFIKFIISSRVIARLGLASTLLITPVLLLIVSAYIIFFNAQTTHSYLYLFGVMVLLSEILRSAIQEPVFFVLFQPLNIHLRLRGHLIAKGFMLPPALIITGLFLFFYVRKSAAMAIPEIAVIVFVLLVIWICIVFWVKKTYLTSLQKVIQKGYFSGSELFLNDDATRQLLLQKAGSKKASEVIHTLDLLERSGYEEMDAILLEKLQAKDEAVIKYILNKIILRKIEAAIPFLEKMYISHESEDIQVLALEALCQLDEGTANKHLNVTTTDPQLLKAAIVGASSRHAAMNFGPGREALKSLTFSKKTEDRLLAAECLHKICSPHFTLLLEPLLMDGDTAVQMKSMAAAAFCKDEHVLPIILNHLNIKALASAAENALVHYGDAIFAKATLAQSISAKQKEGLMHVATRVKGKFADAFLIRLLKDQNDIDSKLIDALYQKKLWFTESEIEIIENYIKLQLGMGHTKCQYALVLKFNEHTTHLYNAIITELQIDSTSLLKAFYLLYDRQKTNRVIEIFNTRKVEKLANAIEMLDHTIPRHYFEKFHTIIDFLADGNENNKAAALGNTAALKSILEHIIKADYRQFNSWTKAIACMVIYRQKDTSLLTIMQRSASATDERILTETRAHVISSTSLLNA